MIRELMYKLFGLEPFPCPVCEVLRIQLDKSEKERQELLQRVLAPPNLIVETKEMEELKPIKPQYVPWKVRQQMFEAEDRKKAQLMREKAQEISELEKELGVASEK